MDTLVSYEFTGIIISAGTLLVVGILIGVIVRKASRKHN